tara:strand:+ start:153 stop:398 length:246 start_codon:yes stop_codon:yes gene_type:complete
MKFEEITDTSLLKPGEMIFHTPSDSIVVYAALVEDTVRVFTNGTLLEDEVQNFKKIVITKKQFKKYKISGGRCKGCGSKKK